MIDTMYDLPSDKDAVKVIVDEQVVNGIKKPTVIKSQIA